MSYTKFEIKELSCHCEEKQAVLRAEVTNIGGYADREVVQVYYSAPQGLPGKPKRELAAFQKTRLLQPGERQVIPLPVSYASMASYDDLGKVQKSAYILESGEYHFYVGNSVEDAKDVGQTWNLAETRIVEQLSAKAVPHRSEKRLLASGEYEKLPMDEPAGLRIAPECNVTTTAWPCATLLACTWDTELVEQVGWAGAEEVKENPLGVWLTPAMNIHRSPLCGRNFEYYSEDPYLAGKMGTAMVRGIQSIHIGASVKHFACNNKEMNRLESDSRVSERALREIYRKAFEIVVKEEAPYTIMSSYHLLNGTHTSENRDLLTGILREEWEFDGMVTTDWWTLGEHYREAKAGNDIKMACGYPRRVVEALEKGYVTREELECCVSRIISMILKID